MNPLSPWDTLESDPAVFTSLLRDLGVKGTEVIELLDLDQLTAPAQPGVQSPIGVVFLFKIIRNHPPAPQHTPASAATVYFAQQTAHNACATQALINLLLNKRDSVDIGPTLGEFYAMTSFLDPLTRGDAIAQHETLRTVHNSYSPYVSIRNEISNAHPQTAGDAFHFVTFFHANGVLWELDGLQRGPICHAECSATEWQASAARVLEKRIQAISERDSNGIQFNLLAVMPDRVEVLEKKIAEHPEMADELMAEIEYIRSTNAESASEMVRRKHNYLPTVAALLRAMAKKGDLQKSLEAFQKAQASTSASEAQG